MQCARATASTALPDSPRRTPAAFAPRPQARAQELRRCYREAAASLKPLASDYAASMDKLRGIFPPEALSGDELDVPFTADGLRLAMLNAERCVADVACCVHCVRCVARSSRACGAHHVHVHARAQQPQLPAC